MLALLAVGQIQGNLKSASWSQPIGGVESAHPPLSMWTARLSSIRTLASVVYASRLSDSRRSAAFVLVCDPSSWQYRSVLSKTFASSPSEISTVIMVSTAGSSRSCRFSSKKPLYKLSLLVDSSHIRLQLVDVTLRG